MIEELYQKYCGCAYRVTTDSRTIQGGELFFALKGENFDGNQYAMSALEKGAAWAVVREDAELPDDDRLIRVEDPFVTLQELAVYHREHVSVNGKRLPVIGLTGTNGKTTTKELIAAVLSRKFKVCATVGNLNNDIGVPLSLLKITPDTQIAVIEMGASHPDDIAKLVRVARPDYGLITNVGRAHLQGFGSLQGVMRAKGELYKYLGTNRGSVIFLNQDDANLRGMAASVPCHTYGYGLGYQCAHVLPTTAGNPFLSLTLNGRTIRTHLVGAYNAYNVLAALTVGIYFGVDRSGIYSAIEEYTPDNNRSQMVKSTFNTLIVDAYNANPSSMNAALDNFSRIDSPSKVALLGDMRELGSESLKEHCAIVSRLSSDGVEAYLVGEEFRRALVSTGAIADKDAGGSNGTPVSSGSGVKKWFATSDQLANHLKSNPLRGRLILVKGSRGIRMENVLKFI